MVTEAPLPATPQVGATSPTKGFLSPSSKQRKSKIFDFCQVDSIGVKLRADEKSAGRKVAKEKQISNGRQKHGIEKSIVPACATRAPISTGATTGVVGSNTRSRKVRSQEADDGQQKFAKVHDENADE